MKLKITAVIPARYKSTRFEGKPLADICGKPMIQHVYERVRESTSVDNVLVATDDRIIYDTVKAFHGDVVMTSNHETGTDRVFEAVSNMETDIVLNIQGDEPLVTPSMIDSLVSPFLQGRGEYVTTLCCEITDRTELNNKNVVKVVSDLNGYALYFSRECIPCVRDSADFSSVKFYKHMGFYAYKKEFLSKYVTFSQSKLEVAEKLEQLRVLENGYKIKMVQTEFDTVGVDTKEDLKRVIDIISKLRK